MAKRNFEALSGKDLMRAGREVRQPEEILQGRSEGGDRGVVEHAHLELAGQDILVRFDAIGPEPFEDLRPSPEDAQHRAEDLVAREDEEIDAARLDIENAVGGVMDGVDGDETGGALSRTAATSSFRGTREPFPFEAEVTATKSGPGIDEREEVRRRRAFPRL